MDQKKKENMNRRHNLNLDFMLLKKIQPRRKAFISSEKPHINFGEFFPTFLNLFSVREV